MIKSKTCAVCGVDCFDPFERDGKFICDVDCLEKYYINRIQELELSVKSWKDAWFDMRYRVGRLGYRFLIPESYKKDRWNKEDWNKEDCNITELYELLDSNVE